MSPAALAILDRVRRSEFASAMLAGLNRTPKRTPAKLFYDAAGSELFERITTLPEYYPTRTELAILRDNAAEMAAFIGTDAQLVEFGAGALRKVRILLDAMVKPRGYVPIDISGDFLLEVAQTLEAEYPHICVNPVVADFTKPIVLGPLECTAMHRVGFFPGSTIGNFTRPEAVSFLRNARQTLEGGPLLIGVDLVKDPAILHAAYNDAAGVTAAFNKNLLVRANRELDADFDVEAFDHYAPYNPVAQRVEMYLVAKSRQRVRLAGETITFAQGEAIHTEDSHKYTLESFRAVAAEAGYAQRKVWTDPAALFSVQWLEAV
jgi:dimethylhistidine N-methyltransferase